MGVGTASHVGASARLPESAARGGEVVQGGERRSARIESTRAIAALAVLGGHAWSRANDYGPSTTASVHGELLFGGGLGVYLFLGLTGYLLYWPFVRQDFGGSRAVDLVGYARNRALRIMPLYAAAIGLLLVADHGGGNAQQWLRFGTFTANFWSDSVATVDGPLWTVVMEMHFYLVLPVLSFAVARLSGGSLRRAALALGVIGIVGLVLWLVHVTPDDGDDRLWRYNLPANLHFFVAGMLVALLRHSIEATRPRWISARIVGSADVWLAAAAGLWLATAFHLELAPVLTVASALVIGACVLPLRCGPVLRLLDIRPLAVVGVASYSLYAWHGPIVEHLPQWAPGLEQAGPFIAVSGVLSLLAAFASYRLIELPFLRMRTRWSVKAPIPTSGGGVA